MLDIILIGIIAVWLKNCIFKKGDHFEPENDFILNNIQTCLN